MELVLVIDKKEYIALDENLSKVYQHCKDIANIINAVSTTCRCDLIGHMRDLSDLGAK